MVVSGGGTDLFFKTNLLPVANFLIRIENPQALYH